jgi:hypothetical protein
LLFAATIGSPFPTRSARARDGPRKGGDTDVGLISREAGPELGPQWTRNRHRKGCLVLHFFLPPVWLSMKTASSST